MVATPDGRKFVDVAALAAQTGHPVRTDYKNPGDPDVLPPADAMIVAPATVNTINKWAAGIADTLALGLLVEGHGHGAADRGGAVHQRGDGRAPGVRESIDRLRDWGVTVLYGDEVLPAAPARAPATGTVDEFPWQLALRRCAARS